MQQSITALSRLAISLGLATSVAHADGLQPLAAFLAGAKASNPDNVEAKANVEQATAQADTARGRYLPSLSAQGLYTRNQFESSFSLSPEQTFTIQSKNGLDAFFVLSVPIVDVAAWRDHRASKVGLETVDASRIATEIDVEDRVTRAYYELLGSEAMASAATRSTEVAADNLKTVRERRELGTASDLDLQRAIATVAEAQKGSSGFQVGGRIEIQAATAE